VLLEVARPGDLFWPDISMPISPRLKHPSRFRRERTRLLSRDANPSVDGHDI